MNVKRVSEAARPRAFRRGWSPTGRSISALVAGLLIAGCGLVAGCGSDDDGKDSVSPSADSDPAVAYAACMRENGVPEFPDPVDGRIQLQVSPGSGLDPGSSEFQRAEETCQDMAPSGLQAGGGPPADLQAQALDHARCMRENGVPEFPEPSFDGGRVRMQLPPGVDPSSEKFQAAMRACQDLAPQGLGGQ